MKLTIDFETRSRVDLKKCGMYVYAEDESTDVLCMAVKVDAEPSELWVPEKFEHLWLTGNAFDDFIYRDEIDQFVEEADIIEAHNLGFEAIIWQEIMVNRYGFKPLPFEKLRCSAAKGASFALPRSLDGLCKALGLDVQKDMDGYKIMMKMCKPNSRTDKWNEDPADFEKLCMYCLGDTDAEHAGSEALYDLPDSELQVWRMDQEINNRGVFVDVDAINNLKEKVQVKEKELLLEVQKITEGQITSVRQVAAFREWLKDHQVDLPDLAKGTVSAALKKDMLPKARRLLEIRQSLSKSSVSKLDAMARRANKDQRVRGTLMYHGASTGRWSGRGIQPQNFPRDTYEESDIESILSSDVDMIEMLYDCPIQAASKCLRGMITAAPGYELVCADFSSIEARVLAWLANEEKIIQAYNDGMDTYKLNAVDIYQVKYEDVSKPQRQIGKVAELALGYQGWLGAFQAMAVGYGVVIEDDKAVEIVKAWRNARPNTVDYWAGIEYAALQAVKTKGVYSYGRIKFGYRDGFLHCRLPSGRLLSYYQPAPAQVKTKYGVEKEVISFMGTDSYTNRWARLKTYGGKLTENIVQAISRDLLVYAMLNVEKAGYPVVLHVHDEAIAEVLKGTGNLEEFEKIMGQVPEWAQGLPLNAEGWIGHRYRK